MTSKNFGNIYIVKLKKGEEVISSLENFARVEEIRFAWISGLGGLEKASIGYYNLGGKQYHFKDFSGDLEVTSLEGNIASFEGKSALHIHLTISDENQNTLGGHLKEAVVGGTLELRVETFDQEINRVKDDDTGLDLLDF